jgi:adenylylsulfate kinase-like enzyme
MPLKVIVLSGSMGSGKTTVLGEMSDILCEQGAPHAAFDLDAVTTVLLPDAAAQEVNSRNLAAICRNVLAAGVVRLLVAEALETRSQFERIREALPGADITVCRLTASLATMESRLRVREPGMYQDRFVVRSRVLDERMAAAKLENFIVVNDGRSVTDVAREVLQCAGWIA